MSVSRGTRDTVRRVPPTQPTLREATPADAERVARAAVEAWASYASFAPAGWHAPAYEPELEQTRKFIADPEQWCLLAEVGDALVGQIAILPAASAVRSVDDPGLAHMRNLFVREDHWGTGLALTLHAAALEAARARGFERMRLFSAAGQSRARRFYEREGWVPAGPEFHDPVPNLAIIEYRYELRDRPPRPSPPGASR
jgi:GNAT superfamily N-acetyltransferase